MKWIRNPSDEEAIRQGCTFDEDAAERPIQFIERFCKQSIGRWKGKALWLFEWEKDFVRRLFGWKRADGKRRFRKGYLEIAKKNGKSTLLSALEIYCEVGDGEGAPEIHILAGSREQAGIIFNESARMVEASPELKRRLKVIGGTTPTGRLEKRIVDEANNGAILCNSSVADTKDGMNPSHVFFDELHRQPNRELWDVYEHASIAREQPIRIAITTAGEAEEGVWHEEREHAEAVNNGTIIDLEYLGVVYRALPADDIDDPATWRKANPSMGETFSEADFKADLERAKENPIKLALFKRLRLNIVCMSSVKFMPPERWKACDTPPRPLSALRLVPCYGGGDLSATTDLTAAVFLFGSEAEGYDLHCRCYLPEEDIVALEHRDRVPYRVWAQHGYLTLTPGPMIDYAFIRRDINEIARASDLRKFLLDPCNATQLGTDLKESDGLPIEMLRQGLLSLTSPTKELLRLVMARKIRHGGHPLLTWNVLNALAVEGDNGALKLSKKKSRLKIDLAAALVNAVAAAMAGESSSGSVYNVRDLILL